MYYLCEALLPELDNIEHEVAAEPLLVEVHLPSESLHLHLHTIKNRSVTDNMGCDLLLSFFF
jgi:hypothetical protein